MKHLCVIKPRGRRAFSLIAVLVIALAGMALVGGILYTFNSFSGASRQVTSDSFEYNLLQEATERGKADVRDKILAIEPPANPTEFEANNPDKRPMKWKDGKAEGSKIGSPNDLLINLKEIANPQVTHITTGAGGARGVLTLYIFDMEYSTSNDLAPSLSDNDRAQLPPAIQSEADTAGTYLIRAVFVDDDTGVEKSIETAIVQSMRCVCGCKGLCGCGDGGACGSVGGSVCGSNGSSCKIKCWSGGGGSGTDTGETEGL